jgi:ubiquitin C-terminal hydrolase
VWLKRGNPEAGQNEKQSNNQSSKNFKQSEEEREREKEQIIIKKKCAYGLDLFQLTET